MFKRIGILAAAFLMLIAAGRVNDESNTERFINRRTGEVRSAAQTPGRGENATDRDLRESGIDRDRTESASGSLGRRIEPVEVTYDISGISPEIPEGSDPEGDDSDVTSEHAEAEPPEGGADPAVEEYDWEVVDDGQYEVDGDAMHERYDVAPDGGTPAEDCGADGGSEPAAEGSEQADGGSDLEYTGIEQDPAVDSYAVEEVEGPVPEMEYLGDWTISFYCPCSECCGEWAGGPTASGTMPSAWWTAATGDLPFGTILYVDGLGTFEVQDRGTGYGWLDIYVSSHDEALANGLQTRAVYIVH